MIHNKDDPIEAYKFLKERYKISDTAARQKLLGQLKNTTLNKFKYSVEDYVSKVFEIRENLQDYNKEFEDNEIAKYILNGLPDSYNDFKRKYSSLMWYRNYPDGHDLETPTDQLLKEGTR